MVFILELTKETMNLLLGCLQGGQGVKVSGETLCHDKWWDALKLILQKVFVKRFCKRQFQHKSVNFLFISVTVKDKLMDLWGN